MTPLLGIFGIPSGMEVWIILLIALLLFGHRIPAMARSMGSGIVEFKKGLKGSDDDKDDPPGPGSGDPDAAVRPKDPVNTAP